ncbi:hypothetical protein SDC9_110086 [bioreactor metagenome]|uniref:Uncharacterized protein n=1 Tax=bioreactor metagenome TaxID=1076179 RepID=A0A645BDN0_9ZZZZ
MFRGISGLQGLFPERVVYFRVLIDFGIQAPDVFGYPAEGAERRAGSGGAAEFHERRDQPTFGGLPVIAVKAVQHTVQQVGEKHGVRDFAI